MIRVISTFFLKKRNRTHFNASSANDAPKAGLETPVIVVPTIARYVEGLGLFRGFLK
jgi:hypothetical protein